MLQGNIDEDEFEFSVCAILSGHTQDVKFVKFHPKDDLLFSASYDNSIKCWEYNEAADDWVCNYTINGHKSTVWQFVFDPTANFLCSCSEDKSWAIWKVSKTEFKNKGFIVGSHLRSIFSIDWNSNDNVVTCGADNRICLYSLSRPGLEDDEVKSVPYTQVQCIDQAHENDINTVSFCPSDPNIIASCSDDHTIKLWRIS